MRVATGVVILTVVPALGTRAALAFVTGRGTGTVTASTGTWAAVATTTGTQPYGPVTMTFTKAKNAPQYLSILNTGTLALTGVTTEIVLSGAGTGSLTACSTGWTPAGSCAGSTTVLDDQTPGATTTSIPLAVGAQLSVKVTAMPSKGSFSVTINVTVPGTLARPPTTSSS